jgi:plastocyanin
LITTSDPAVIGKGGFTYTATEGSTATAQTVATFTDPGGAEPLADYSATIDWGDGTSSTAGTISVDPTTHVFTVTGEHTYAQDGTFTVDVTLTHETAPAVTVSSTAQIANATITGAGGIAATAVAVSGYEFKALTGVSVATFTDGDGSLPAGDFSATIDWGDGTSSVGSVSLSGATYTVSGTHTYDDEGHYTVQVSIDQSAGMPSGGATSATVGAQATIHEQLLENGTVGTPDQNWVQEVYRDLFDRQAELSGLNYWVAMLDAGQTRGQVAYDIVQLAFSEEFQRDTVVELYQQYLGRAPDAGGDAFWTSYLYDGGTIESMAQALVSSSEYWQRAGGTDAGFLQALFQDALGRAIDPTALQYYEGLMAHGQTAADIASIVFNSDEYHRVRVNALFEQFLDRPADAGGLAFFAGELDSGYTDELVITQLISSDEYYDDVQV